MDRGKRFVVLAAAIGAVLACGAPQASAATCVSPSAYPGDDAPKERIAAWMATGAGARGLPGELPVMAALVESGLRNLPGGDLDSAGYFQMRKRYWDQGEYAGYATNPPLQLQWFVDSAIRNTPADPADSAGWGAWIANVEKPAEQYRSRYQPRLAEARWLVAAGCELYADGTAPPPVDPEEPPASAEDTAPPVRKLTSLLEQDVVARRGLVISVACPAEACTAKARATISLPGLDAQRLEAPTTPLGAGARARLKLRVPTTLRRSIAAALRRDADGSARRRLIAAGEERAQVVEPVVEPPQVALGPVLAQRVEVLVLGVREEPVERVA
jgi:hypothetical protein